MTPHKDPNEANTVPGDYLSITRVAKLAPGRPSTNCIWRWCRKGVLSRSGERVRLKHIRIGGMIYSTRQWLDEFGRCLAEADEKYFDFVDAAQRGDPARRRRKESRTEEARRLAIEDADRELRAAGI
ncbi:MAG: hypothetical protein DCC63_14865 [Nitrospira sp.]|nr:MAG: hypothetical protein DCC63_14865 [Nitrospira sp.]